MGESNSRTGQHAAWLLVIPVIIVAALVLNGLDPVSGRSRLYFLDANRIRLAAETRKLALVGSIEERALLVLEELMLGPAGHALQPLFRQDARLREVMHRGSMLHVAIEIPDLAGLDIPFGLIRSAFEKSLASAVPGSGSLELYINGSLAVR